MNIQDFIGQKAVYDDAGQMIWGVDKDGGSQLLMELSVRGWGAILLENSLEFLNSLRRLAAVSGFLYEKK